MSRHIWTQYKNALSDSPKYQCTAVASLGGGTQLFTWSTNCEKDQINKEWRKTCVRPKWTQSLYRGICLQMIEKQILAQLLKAVTHYMIQINKCDIIAK